MRGPLSGLVRLPPPNSTAQAKQAHKYTCATPTCWACLFVPHRGLARLAPHTSPTQGQLTNTHMCHTRLLAITVGDAPARSALCARWAEAPEKIARMTLTIKLDGNWSSFQLANSAPPLSVTDSAIAPSARMPKRDPFGPPAHLRRHQCA